MNDRSRYLFLAIVNGVVSFIVLAAIERIQILQIELQNQIQPPAGYVLQSVPFWTWPILLFHVLLFIIAALIVRRYLLNSVGPGLFFWLAVAVIVCVAWFVMALTGAAIGTGNSGDSIIERILQALIDRSSQQRALNFALAVFGVNFVFGVVVHVAGKHSWRRQPRFS